MKIGSAFHPLPRDRPFLGMAAGAGIFSLAIVLRWFVGGLSDAFGPTVFLPAILIAGLIGGIQVGSAVAVVCVMVAWVWFFRPYGTFVLTDRDEATMTIFTVTAGLELYAIQSLSLAISNLSLARERSNTLFRELQHRVANNLQVVSSLLYLRKKMLEPDSAGARALEAARSRLDLMSRVHRRLHDPGVVDLPVGHYLEDLCRDLIEASDAPRVRLTVEAAPIKLDLESLMSVSLIVAELVTNSLKHAFRDRSDGSIAISFTVSKHVHTLTVADDGCGVPPNSGSARGAGLGQGILQSLASQLSGKISFERGHGTTARLTFPA